MMLKEAIHHVGYMTIVSCLQTYESTIDPQLKAACGWRIISGGIFSELVELTGSLVDPFIQPSILTKDNVIKLPILTKKKIPIREKLLVALSNGGKWKTNDLAKHCNCLPATIRIGICDLRRMGKIINGPIGGGYYLGSSIETKINYSGTG